MSKEREHTTGQYTNPMDSMCVCGFTKGTHLAEKPHEGSEAECPGFKKAKPGQKFLTFTLVDQTHDYLDSEGNRYEWSKPPGAKRGKYVKVRRSR